MKLWKEVDKNGVIGDIKVVVSDKLLNHKYIHTYEHPGKFDDNFVRCLPSSGIYFKDKNNNDMLFFVSINGVDIFQPVDDLCFITSKPDYDHSDVMSILSASIKYIYNFEDSDSTVVFTKPLDKGDIMYIDINDEEEILTINIKQLDYLELNNILKNNEDNK